MIFYLAALQAMPPELGRSRRARRRLALELLPPRHLAAADADHAVRAGQRRDQRVPRWSTSRGHDPRRAGQCDHAAALSTSTRSASASGIRAYAAALTVVLLALLCTASRCACSSGVARHAEMHYQMSTADPYTARPAGRALGNGRRLAARRSCGSCRLPTRCGRPSTRRNSPRVSCSLAPLTLDNFARAWDGRAVSRAISSTPRCW